MFLEKLELNGFKSFAHKTTLEFKPGITAIVGPNGSGKSNIADAVRWVLGEQSIKLLRGKKSEDVIFSGSDKKARLGMAEVSLYFNNEKDKHNLGMSEICFTRKLYRNGESEYLINKQRSRLTDIQMLLTKVGIARTSYSIIGQGMIDLFLLSTPQERKELFEEASGVKPLQIKRQQSLNKLERTEENLETAQIQLQEITPRLNSLSRQVKKLERRAEVELNLKNIQQKYYASIWHEIDKDRKVKDEKLKKLVSDQEKAEKEVDKLQNEIARLTKESAKSENSEKLQSKYQEILEERIKLSEKLANLKIKNTRAVPVKKQGDIPPDLSQRIIELLDKLDKLNGLIKNNIKNRDWSQIEKLFTEQRAVIDKLHNLTRPFRGSSDQAHKTQSESTCGFGQEINDLENKIKEIDKQMEEVQAEIKRENEKNKDERSRIWKLQQNYQVEQQNLNQASNQVNSLRIELARLETKRDDLEQEIEQELGDNGLAEIKQHPAPTQTMTEDEKRTMITEIGKLKHQLELIGGIDPEVQKEYEEIKVRHEFLSNQINDLKKSIESLEELINQLDETIKEQFEASFKIINQEFQKYFKTLFGGGRAKLTLVKSSAESENPNLETQNSQLEIQNSEEGQKMQKIKSRLKSAVYAGVDIEATPPGKKLKSINMLSGGERALTSVALICAIISANPSPFVILDEVDAAFDEANSIRFADILEELSHKSQFIIITHNRATMEKADILYGVTMGNDGVSTLLSLKLESAEKYTNR